MLNSSDEIVKLYQKLLQIEGISEEVLLTVSKVGSLVLVSENIRLPQEHASVLIRKSLNVKNDAFLLDFVKNLVDYSSFEALILPVFLRYFSENLNTISLRLLTEIVMTKSPVCYNGIGYATWRKYPLEFPIFKEKTVEYLIKYITVEKIDDIELANFICALICIPHVNSLNNVTINELLERIISIIMETGRFDDENVFILTNTISCMTHLVESSVFHDFVRKNDLVTTLLTNGRTAPILSLTDLILTSCNGTEMISMEMLSFVHEKVSEFLTSPFHELRLIVTHIYSLFENLSELPEKVTDENIEKWNVFSLCYKTESIESHVHTYRDQLQNLQKLSYDKTQGILCKDTEFATVPLRYLLGTLYINFQLLWNPVVEIITSYANGMPILKFWDVFHKQLTDCDDFVKNAKENPLKVFVDDFINKLYFEAFKLTNIPDYVNYRLLLWKAMCEFVDVAEAKNRDIVPLMLSFVENEYKNTPDALSLNIKQKTETEDNEDDDEDNDDTPILKKTGKPHLKTLLHQLSFFSKIRNPKSLYREPELFKLYLELLSHRNSEVQKSALDCIMVYKHKYLVPYKDNLYALIDEKRFKNEVAAFRIDKESNMIQETHRNDFMPIVLRIVFSKMVTKTGMRTGGKAAGQNRRNLILRFLAGCQENEMMIFLQMVFKNYQSYIADDPKETVTSATAIDLERFVPPKRLQSSVNLLTVIIDQFGGLMSPTLLGYLLKILLTIEAMVDAAMSKRSEIHIGYINALKNVRSSSTTLLKRFFEQFDSYPWTCNEIDAVFNVFVWPWIRNISVENVHSPTPLLKLILSWGQNPRYFPLLVKTHDGDYALKTVIELLTLERLHPTVTNMITEVLEKLLLLKPREDENVIDVNDTVPISDSILQQLKINEQLNYGSCILLPFVPKVLEKLKRKLSGKGKGVNAKESFILSRISELVWEPEICNTVLTLLLPMVSRKAAANCAEETLVQLVSSVNNLMKNIAQPEVHIRQTAPLLCEMNSIEGRKLLVQTLSVMAKNNQDMEMVFEVISHLNAFDTRWLDQPDFDKRLKGFKIVSNYVQNDSLSVDLGIALIYNSFYIVKYEKDLALRECASMCLRNVIPYLLRKESEKDYLLNGIILDLIRRGITNKNENYRHESISLLGYLARECPNSHNILNDLSKLSNKLDLEVDFFENLIHLQLYRQTRTLNKFVQIYQQLSTPPSVRTLTQFILPLTTSYLLMEKFAQKNSLIDASIESLKIITRLLPWHQYESILRFYLTKLRTKREFQKQLVRIVVAVLDSYHFDLSKVITEPEEYTKQSVEIIEPTESMEQSVESTEPSDDTEDQELDKMLDETESDIDESETVSETLPINRQTILGPSAAKRVIHSIQNILLPQLKKTMAELTSHEASHKVNRKKTGIEHEEEELQKVPISLAVVKLLQRLPKHILERNLPGIFMKLCSFFKSHLESVRRTTRETLQKIMTSLGPEYLGLLIKEMSTMLSRGFQVHVLIYSIHSVLVSLKELYKPKDIDKCLVLILDLCKVDLFGSASEEKEVAKIGSKVSEAKSTKGYDTFQILAQYITEKCLLDLVLPLKEVLMRTHSFKIVNKVQECLRRIVLGLVENVFIPTKSLLVFAYGTASESIPQFMAMHSKKKLTEEEREKKSRERVDCFIIPKAPVGRSGVRNKVACTSLEANSHLLVEFGLRLCFFLLKREKVEDYASFIDPFVIVFKNCLKSRHVKMCTLTLQCLGWVVKYDIPAMQEHMKDITKSIFELLHKYAAAGLSKGDNFDLVVAAFKTMAIIVRDVKYHTIETDQLKVLLIYAEQDLHDFERQATAFGLLKAIIARKLIVPEIHEVMKKVSELSITSEVPHIRLQCRQVFHQFLMDYPLGKKLDVLLSFYLSQLSYELQPGRESALEMVQTIVSTFPVKTLKQQSGMFFVMLGARLVNDDAPECRKMVAKSLHTILERVDKPQRDNLFDIVKSWFKDKKITHRRLAAQLCGIFVTVEKSQFGPRLPEIIPDIIQQFCNGDHQNGPGKFVRLPQVKSDDDGNETKPQDHHLFQVLQLLLKICNHCPVILENVDDIETLASYIQRLLSYPHEWVRLASTQFIGYVLSVLNITHLSELLQNKTYDPKGYLYSNPSSSVKSLTLDLCDQLQPGSIKPELAEQVVKNLVFMARVLQNISGDDSDDMEKPLTLLWLTRRMRKIINFEIVQASKSTTLRTEVFKWIAGVVTTIPIENLSPVLHHLLAPLVREMATTEDSIVELRRLAKEVGGIIRKKIGSEEYITLVSKLQVQLNVKRAERKRERMQLAITDPEAAAKKKIKLNEKKKVAKKRKIEGFKGKRPMKKRRKVDDMMDSSEVM